MPATRILIGCGYLGSRVLQRWRGAGEYTAVTTRQDNPTSAMVGPRTWTGQADVTKPETLYWLAHTPSLGGTPPESLLYAVGYDRSGGADIHAVYAGGLRNVLAALPPSVTRAIYVSTTGVYGSADGDWVDELTPPDPQREGGRASLAAEQVLAAHPLGRHSAILRMAGLYGPGRVPHLDKLRAGEPIPAPSDGWLNLIHVDDAACIVVAADSWLASLNDEELAAQSGPHIFCVSDGHPVARADYYSEVARVLGAPQPAFVAPSPDLPAAARANASRRVNNSKMLETFGVALNFPSYREGLASILAGQS
jgi:nucleoside-diphosphate-sugar epimerase